MIKLKMKDPLVKGLNHHAYTLAIAGEHPDFDNWFFSNYIQLECHDNMTLFPLNFYRFKNSIVSNPLLKENYIERKYLYEGIDYIDFFCNILKQGAYIMTFVNEYYLTPMKAYKKYHFAHDILLYGYDQQSRYFYASGYTKVGKYENFKIGFDEFSLAFERVYENEKKLNSIVPWLEGIHILTLNKGETYTLELDTIINSLKDYVFSINSSKKYSESSSILSKNSFGLEVYDNLITFVKNQKNKIIDIRSFHILYEHKQCMVKRIEFLERREFISQSSYLKNGFQKIEEKALIIRNLVVKYNFTNDNRCIESIINNVKELKKEEENLMKQFIYELEKKIL
mgnify:CR=1 FL=1